MALMDYRSMPRKRAAGFTLIEILITLVVLLVGLLGLVGMQAKAQQAELESYQRGQALVLLQDMVDRMNSNRLDAKNLNYVTAVPAGVGGATQLVSCAGKTASALDLCEWGNVLIGAAEGTAGSNCATSATGQGCVGAMLGARGCISYDINSQLQDSSGASIAGTGVFTVAVAWQGTAQLSSPPSSTLPGSALNCAKGDYPEPYRRVVTATMRIGALKAQ